MEIAILTNNEQIGSLASALLPGHIAHQYQDVDDITEKKVFLITHSFSVEEVKYAVHRLNHRKREVLCFVDRSESPVLNFLKEKELPYLLNGYDSTDTLHAFFNSSGREKTRTIAFISPSGGTGSSFLSAFLTKRIAEKQKVKLVDWNFAAPSLYHYFGIDNKEGDIVPGLTQLRNGKEIDIKDYQISLKKTNITLALMSLNYIHSSRWTANEFVYLWDEYTKEGYDAVIYDLPMNPLSVTSAVALLRADDIVIPFIPEQHSISHAAELIKWLRVQRETDLPNIHLVANKYDVEISGLNISELEKVLGSAVVAQVPNINGAWNTFITGEIFKRKPTKEHAAAVDALNSMANSLGYGNESVGSGSDRGLLQRFGLKREGN